MRIFSLLLLVIASAVAPASGSAARATGPSACTEQITDGGFEAGGAAWQTASAGGYALISQVAPHTGLWGAYLGGYNNANDELAQVVALPTGAAITLRLWWQVQTEETTHPWDTLDVTITPAGGGAAVRLLRLSDGSITGSWQPTALDLSAYAGQTLRLAFSSRTDDNRPTDFFLDDISIEACPAAAVTPTPTATATSAPTAATATATATPSPTITPTPSPTITPVITATPTGTGRRVYLPLAVR